MLKIILFAPLLLLVVSCSSGNGEDLKSPCVGIENSPCGPRQPVNKWLL
ncbi:MAG: hypothetical protein HON42_03800 [Alphaproteobacteria bacterium]|nr:hypothetical protein [Alphaproteobacteria bacterium]MBT5828472.1 hypothetical protein [Alphaproteobacteria bacterium]